jgi:hypothetical protein
MAITAAGLYAMIRAINAKMRSEAPNDNPDYAPFANADDYFAGKLAEAVSEALSVYTRAESTAMDTLIAALSGMTGTPYAPLAAALSAWASAMKTGPDAPDTPVIP